LLLLVFAGCTVCGRRVDDIQTGENPLLAGRVGRPKSLKSPPPRPKATVQKPFPTTGWPGQELVVDIGASNLTAIEETYERMLLIYTDMGIRRCQEFVPQFARAAIRFSHLSPPVFVGVVDMTHPDNAELKDQFGGMAFFPISHFHEKGRPVRTVGFNQEGMTTDGLANWVSKRNSPSVHVVTDPADARLLLQNQTLSTVFGYFADLESEEAQEFMKIGELPQLQQASFAVTSTQAVMDAHDVTAPAMAVFNRHAVGVIGNTRVLELKPEHIGDQDEMAKFVMKTIDYQLGDVRMVMKPFKHFMVNYTADAQKRGRPQMWYTNVFDPRPVVYFLTKDGINEGLVQMALRNRHTFDNVFVDADTESEKTMCNHDFFEVRKPGEALTDRNGWKADPQCNQGGILRYFNITEENLPASIIMFGQLTRYYVLHNIELASFERFSKGALAGTSDEHIRSAVAAPQHETSLVQEIVGSEFQSEVMDGDEDVLLMWYDGLFCHKSCKQMKEIFEKLAVLVKDVSTVKIMKVEGRNNDVRHPSSTIQNGVMGFPALRFFPGHNKSLAYSISSTTNNPAYIGGQMRQYSNISNATLTALFPPPRTYNRHASTKPSPTRGMKGTPVSPKKKKEEVPWKRQPRASPKKGKKLDFEIADERNTQFASVHEPAAGDVLSDSEMDEL
jgi:hypothetical protein